jgi:hypothetical protein
MVLILVGCWAGNRQADSDQTDDPATPAITQNAQNTRSPQSSAALTRVASSLAQAQDVALPTVTPTAANATTSSIPLPTVTPTLVPSPVATRTIEIHGDATLRLQINNDTFESSGQPVVIEIEPRSFTLGGDTMTSSEMWCTQLGPTGLIFDLNFTLQPTTENLHVAGELRLYDGFCGQWGSLGNLLSTVPIEVNVPVGTAAILAPVLQVQGSLLGLPNVLDISTGVYLDLTIRNPNPS